MLPLDEIARLAALQGAEINEAKKVLATEATALVHGRAAAEQAAETARKTFEEGALAETLPTVTVPRARSRRRPRRARRLRRAPASSPRTARSAPSATAHSRSTTQPSPTNDHCSASSDLTPEGVIKLSLGKKRHVLLKPE